MTARPTQGDDVEMPISCTLPPWHHSDHAALDDAGQLLASWPDEATYSVTEGTLRVELG